MELLIFLNEEIEKYEGEWKEDKADGYGILFWRDGSMYNGNWEKGLYNGFGIRYDKNNEYYIGQHKDGAYHGYGIIYYYESKMKIKG